MALSLATKKVMVNEVHDVAAKSLSLVAAEYKGLTVTEMTSLRQQARQQGVYLRVVRNTLARRALENTTFECVVNDLTGPLFLAFSIEAPGSAARLLRDFAKEHEHIKVRIVSLNGENLPTTALASVADLPTYDEAIAKLMMLLKAPAEKLARVLSQPTLKLVRTLMAVRDQKQQ